MSIVNVVEKLGRSASRVYKANTLLQLDSPLLREVLQYTYDPMLKYSVNKLPWAGRGESTIEEQWPAIAALLNSLSQGFGDDSLKACTRQMIQSLRPEDAEILRCIIRKDLRCGVNVGTITEVFPGLITIFGVMRAKQYEPKRWSKDLMGSVKLDGLRCKSQGGMLFTRNGHRILGVEHIEEALKGVPDIDGEIMVPGNVFQEASGKIRSHKLTPDAKLFLFDYLKTPKAPFIDRYNALLDLAAIAGWPTQLNKPSTITVLRHRTFESEAEMYAIYAKAISAGYEGLVLKTPQHPYQEKRSGDWLKVKATQSEDVRIVGFYEGEGRLEGNLGGISVVRTTGKQCNVGSGFSDTERKMIWQDPSAYRGKMVEVAYHENTPEGDYRHARFKRFRPDKE